MLGQPPVTTTRLVGGLVGLVHSKVHFLAHELGLVEICSQWAVGPLVVFSLELWLFGQPEVQLDPLVGVC